MNDLEDEVTRWDYDYLQQQVWDLERKLEKLREEFEKFKELLTGDGK